jgi:acyl-coenzyme A synthetase/AMP-(fatty) acid ligase/acyl carrier protein
LANQKQHLVKLIRSQCGAVAIEQGQRAVSFAELGELIDERIPYLIEQGAAECLVALERPKSVEFIVDYLAVLAIGGTVLPLDPATPADRRQTFLDLTRPDFLLRGQAAVALDADTSRRLPQDGAFIYFTSGSTGLPKPVLGSAAALRSFVDFFCPTFGVGPGDRFVFSAGLSFEASLRDIFPPLCSGATLAIPSSDIAAAPEEAVQWLAHNEISVVTVVPSVARAWLRTGGPLCPRVRLAVFLGEPLTSDLLEGWHAVFPNTAARVNSYGTTESGQATIYRLIGPQDRFEGRIPSGKAVPGTKYCFIESEAKLDADLVRARLERYVESGEIVIVSRACSHGYLGLPAENEARFTDLGDGVKAYRTGDLGRTDENGDLVVIGRADDEVKINGVRVHPAEVILAIRAHPAVADAFVIASKQGGESRLTAYLVPAHATRINLIDLRRDLMEVLPLAMIPSGFVQVSSFPMLRTGKVDRAALQAIAAPAVEFVEPAGEVERWVADQLTDLLGAHHVSANDDFFALGGDSISATRLAVRVIEGFGVEFSQRDVFAGATVVGITSIIVQQQLLAADPADWQALLDSVEGVAG